MLLEMVIGPFWVWLGIGEKPTNTMILGALMVLIILIFHIVRTQFKSEH
jgi:drug/metabolite transporter (DMT)-like permease